MFLQIKRNNLSPYLSVISMFRATMETRDSSLFCAYPVYFIVFKDISIFILSNMQINSKQIKALYMFTCNTAQLQVVPQPHNCHISLSILSSN